MRLELQHLVERFGLIATSAIHVGGHVGEEAGEYTRSGITRVVWIEANPSAIPELAEAVEPLGHRVVHGVVSDRAQLEAPFLLTNDRAASSTSMTDPRRPDRIVTDRLRMPTITLDDLCEREAIAPSELLTVGTPDSVRDVLAGATSTVATSRYVWLVTSRGDLADIGEMLAEFDCIEVGENGDDHEAIYARPGTWAAPRRVSPTEPTVKRMSATVSRAVAAGVSQGSSDLVARLDALHHLVGRIENDQHAARQQLDEVVEFLRVQHGVQRAILESLERIAAAVESGTAASRP